MTKLLLGGVTLAAAGYAIKEYCENNKNSSNGECIVGCLSKEETSIDKNQDTLDGIKTLTQQEQDKIIYFADSINEQITQTKSKKLTKFLKTGLEVLKDFEVKYQTEATKLDNFERDEALLSKADDDIGIKGLATVGLHDIKKIIKAGVEDIGTIIKEDGFGFKNYKSVENTVKLIELLISRYETQYSLDKPYKILAELEESINSIKDINSRYFQIMNNLKNEIEHTDYILRKRVSIYKTIVRLSVSLSGLDEQISIAHRSGESIQDKVEEVEEFVTNEYVKTLNQAYEFDKLVSALEFVSIDKISLMDDENEKPKYSNTHITKKSKEFHKFRKDIYKASMREYQEFLKKYDIEDKNTLTYTKLKKDKFSDEQVSDELESYISKISNTLEILSHNLSLGMRMAQNEKSLEDDTVVALNNYANSIYNLSHLKLFDKNQMLNKVEILSVLVEAMELSTQKNTIHVNLDFQ